MRKPWLGREIENDELFLPRLPLNYYEQDKLWIAKQIEKMPRQTWQALCDGYCERYDQQINNNDLPEIRRVGFARLEANKWLKEKVNRYLEMQSKCKDIAKSKQNSS